MARDSCSLNLYQMVKIYQDLTIAPVPSAAYLILGNQKITGNLLCINCWKTDHKRSKCSSEECVKYANNQVIPQGRRHVLTLNHRRIVFPEDILSNFFPCELDFCGIKQQSGNHALNILKLCAVAILK